MAVLLACAAAVPATGEVRGPAADLGRELARWLGVSFSIRQ